MMEEKAQKNGARFSQFRAHSLERYDKICQCHCASLHTQSQIYPDLSCGLAELPNAQACGNSLKNSKCLSHLVATMPKASGSTSKVVTLVKFSSISSTLLTNYHNETNHRRKRGTNAQLWVFFISLTTIQPVKKVSKDIYRSMSAPDENFICVLYLKSACP